MGWGGDDNVPCTCTHGRCYATSCFLHLHTWSVLRNNMFLALAHMVSATQHHVSCTCTHGRCYATSCFLHLHTWLVLRNIMFVDVYVRIKLVCICTINGFLLPKFKHWWWPNHRHSKEQPQKAWLSDIAIFSHVQIHCACQCIMTLARKILWPTALLNIFEHLDHHDISKIVILPHKSHVSHKYKCMNDGFFINQRADQKKIVRAEHHSM